MNIGFWNINNVRNKLENEHVLKWLHLHDVVILGETKIVKLPHVPGFLPIMAKSCNPRRGGLAVLVKRHVYPDIYYVDDSVNDQLWFSLSSIPGVRFCGAYITPSSSTYFSEADIANLQAKTIEDDTQFVIVGDLNSRLGAKVNDLINIYDKLCYHPIDLGGNDNGKKVLRICKDNNLMVINNLQTEARNFTSALTYRVGKKWKSELDICIVSKDLIPTVSHFQVNQDTMFPSNHAPVSVCFNFPERTSSLHEMVS